MRVVPWSKGPGPTGIRPRSVGTCNGAWKSSPPRSRPSAGRPRSDSATVAPAHGQRQTCPSGRRRYCPRIACLHVGHCQAGCRGTEAERWLQVDAQSFKVSNRPSAETQPRCGVTLGSVKRPQGTLVPRWRQAPDGGKEGGSQPTDISVINRRVFLAPALPIDKGEKYDADVKKLLPTLDIGSHINAGVKLLPEAGAERTL